MVHERGLQCGHAATNRDVRGVTSVHEILEPAQSSHLPLSGTTKSPERETAGPKLDGVLVASLRDHRACTSAMKTPPEEGEKV